MKPVFDVRVESHSPHTNVSEIWTQESLRALFEQLDGGDVGGSSDDEVQEMCLLALQDLGETEAATALLKFRLGEELAGGQIQNLCHEMQDEKLWREYSDITLHHRLYEIGVLFQAAFPDLAPTPDAVKLRLIASPKNQDAKTLLQQEIDAAFIVRLIGDGTPDVSILHRLYADELGGKTFTDAEHLIWESAIESTDNQTQIDIVCSGYFVESLNEEDCYQSSAFPDVIATA